MKDVIALLNAATGLIVALAILLAVARAFPA